VGNNGCQLEANLARGRPVTFSEHWFELALTAHTAVVVAILMIALLA
jgi:hypothetical protein